MFAYRAKKADMRNVINSYLNEIRLVLFVILNSYYLFQNYIDLAMLFNPKMSYSELIILYVPKVVAKFTIIVLTVEIKTSILEQIATV